MFPCEDRVVEAGLRSERAGSVAIFQTVPIGQLTTCDDKQGVSSSLFLRIRRGSYSCLLEGIDEVIRVQRYSLIATEPYHVYGAPQARPDDGGDGDPLVHVAALVDEMKTIGLPEEQTHEQYADVRDIPFLHGGAIGYVSYDAVRHFEPRVSTRHQSVDALGDDVPESMWLFFDAYVAYDSHKQVCHVVALCRIPAAGDASEREAAIRRNYRAAAERIGELSRRCNSEAAEYQARLPFEHCYPERVPGVVGESNEPHYKSMVATLKRAINAGEILQAVPSQRIVRNTPVHPFHMYTQLRALNPSPYMFYLDMHGFQIVGASPECLVSVDRQRKVVTHPIAGTSRRGRTHAEDQQLERALLANVKETSEHLQLVDLGRNDVNRVAVAGSTTVERFMGIERFSHVMHIVSRVAGTLRPDKTCFDAFRSIFPAGTVSGAPKVRAMELVAELERVRRGVYAGAVGHIDFDGTLDTCIALRTVVFKNGQVLMQAGGGIVFDSDEQAEYDETVHKLGGNTRALELAETRHALYMDRPVQDASTPDAYYSVARSTPAQYTSVVSSSSSTSTSASIGFNSAPPTKTSHRLGGRVLLIDNYDSFTWNIYECLSRLGADVLVVRNDKVTVDDCLALRPDRVLIGPGPGGPSSAGVSMDVIRAFAGVVPVLGVCLGHQCMVELYGGTVSVCTEIMHGKLSVIEHDNAGVFAGVAQRPSVVRYHSLVGELPLPACLRVTATSELGHVMGLRHRELQVEGVQFHPESVKTEHGAAMFANFLRMRGGRQPYSVKASVQLLAAGAALSETAALDAVCEIMSGATNVAQAAAFLALLPVEKVTHSLLDACSQGMLAYCEPVELPRGAAQPLFDIVGTGGDGKNAFNVSTAAAFVVAAALGRHAVTIAKHGNRSSSDACGSADFLEALGARVDLDAADVRSVAERTGFAFLYAPRFHPAMKHAAAARRQLAIRTIFNLLGPLTNPSRPDAQLIGVARPELGPVFARLFAARRLTRPTYVVHSVDGMDELSVAADTLVWRVVDGSVDELRLAPADFGLAAHPIDSVCGRTAAERAADFRAIVDPAAQQRVDGDARLRAVRDFVLLNAACALLATGQLPADAATPAQAAQLAAQALASGATATLLDDWVHATVRAGQKHTILHTILAQRQLDVAAAQQAVSVESLRDALATAPPVVDIVARLRASGRTAVLAEFKRASPSLGDIAGAGVDARDQALAYARAGAAAVSVLTEPTWFKGSLADMSRVRHALGARYGDAGHLSRPAVLRKDFVFDAYQVLEARVHGADSVLLIVAAFTALHSTAAAAAARLRELIELSRSLGMEPLVEVNTDDELTLALACSARLIGVNNRDLHTFRVDVQTTRNLVLRQRGALPHDALVVALSGIHSRADLDHYADLPEVGGVLVGEALMRSPDPGRFIREQLLGVYAPPLVKICGVRTVAEAAACARAGADMVGLVFAPGSPRAVSLAQAQAVARCLRAHRHTTHELAAPAPGSASPGQAVSVPMRRWFGDWADRLAAELCGQHKPLVVGVFANAPIDDVLRTARDVPLDLVQLSGGEDDAYVRQLALSVPVVHARHVAAGDSAAALLDAVATGGYAAALLFDTAGAAGGRSGGGTGLPFDWQLARELQQQLPIVLAGGLSPNNVADAVRQVRPFAVDVSSGVEGPGHVKDAEKIRAFVRMAKFAVPRRHTTTTITDDNDGSARHSAGIDGSVTPLPNKFGRFGGRYAPETLVGALEELERVYWQCKHDAAFQADVQALFASFIGRPTPLYFAKALTRQCGGARIWFKREDLCHTGAHKINNAIAQALLAMRLGKRRIIAETGAGQHGVATATACALLGLECIVYMGAEDCARQSLNVFRMRNLGATVVAVQSGAKTLKDAINEAMRDWVTNVETTHYLVGSAIGPHPFPTIVRDFQSCIGAESKDQMILQAGKLPDLVVACVGGGSNAIGLFHPYLDEATRIVGAEAAGEGVDSGKHSATLAAGTPGVLHGTKTFLLQDAIGQVIETHSISAGLDYPGVGPEHAHIKDVKRGVYLGVTDEQAMLGYHACSRAEGIVPALETSHAIYLAMQLAKNLPHTFDILVGISGRGDKDYQTVAKIMGVDLNSSLISVSDFQQQQQQQQQASSSN